MKLCMYVCIYIYIVYKPVKTVQAHTGRLALELADRRQGLSEPRKPLPWRSRSRHSPK